MIRQEGPFLTSSPRVRVGEIDTSAPFQSVKDAVSLFGVRAFSPGKPSINHVKQHSSESAFAKETQLHLAENELNQLKEKLRHAEITKSEALEELEKARRSEKELTEKTEAINESKDIALKLTESAKQYAEILGELDAAKRELARIRQDYAASLEAKTFSENKIEEMETLRGEINALRKEMETLRSITHDVDVAKLSLQKVLDEEIGLKKQVEARKKLEAAEKEIEDTKTATEEAVKRAEMDEAAKNAIEGELRRLRERERSEETDGRVKFEKQKSEMWLPASKKLERRRTSMGRKASIPHLGGIFRRKKSQVAQAASPLPSYLPTEGY